MVHDRDARTNRRVHIRLTLAVWAVVGVWCIGETPGASPQEPGKSGGGSSTLPAGRAGLAGTLPGDGRRPAQSGDAAALSGPVQEERLNGPMNERAELAQPLPSSRRHSSLAYDSVYTIGPSDTLEVIVWGEPEFTRPAIVRRDGRITMPLVQDVEVAGLTPMEAAQAITEKLRQFVLEPQVTVIVQSTSSSSYYVFGEVAGPGEYPLRMETTVMQAVIRAGGFRQAERSGQIVETGDLSRIVLYRENPDGTNTTYNLNLAGYADDGPAGAAARANDIVLQPGDRIFVPEKTRIAYVLGEVRAPGIVALGENTTLLQALTERGGEISRMVSNLKKIWVVRQEGGKANFRSYDLRKLLKKGDISDNIVLRPGDVVYVPKTAIGSLQEFILFWSSTLQPAMSTYQQAWDAYYTDERYSSLRRNDFGQRNQIIQGTGPGGTIPPDIDF